ncbi:MAG: response regulator transcription factor [Candidatus Aminicenantes bacterium]|nr:response regulator transcription factor [Candidatus Aminicenantes bacterium]
MKANGKQAAGSGTETVLVVEDDRALRRGLAMNFELRGYRVLTAADGDEGITMAFDSGPDLIVLDIMLPGFSGLEILSALREKGRDVPILILSARGTTDSKIEGLGLGADDYLAKPFALSELFARVEALLRRRRAEKRKNSRLVFDDLSIDLPKRRVTLRGRDVELSAKEFDLLALLAGSPGKAFRRDDILDRVWGFGFDGTARTVDNFILSLRQKIEADPSSPAFIKTVRQVGYKFNS